MFLSNIVVTDEKFGKNVYLIYYNIRYIKQAKKIINIFIKKYFKIKFIIRIYFKNNMVPIKYACFCFRKSLNVYNRYIL